MRTPSLSRRLPALHSVVRYAIVAMTVEETDQGWVVSAPRTVARFANLSTAEQAVRVLEQAALRNDLGVVYDVRWDWRPPSRKAADVAAVDSFDASIPF